MVVNLHPALTSGHAQKIAFGKTENHSSYKNLATEMDTFVRPAKAESESIFGKWAKLSGKWAKRAVLASSLALTAACGKDEPVTPVTPSQPTELTPQQIETKNKEIYAAKYGVSSQKSAGDSIAYLDPTGEIIANAGFKPIENNVIKSKQYIMNKVGGVLYINDVLEVESKYDPKDTSFVRKYFDKNNNIAWRVKEYMGSDGKVIEENLLYPDLGKVKYLPIPKSDSVRREYLKHNFHNFIKILHR